MRSISILLVSAFLAGCATQRSAVVATMNPPAERTVVREAAATSIVETRYDVRGYRDADDPAVRHEPHAVYRTTRVPARVASLDTVPRNEFAPVSYAPLPSSAELAAELAAQKHITAELREIHASMAAVEQQAQAQYGTLVNQTAETIKLRRQLENERAQAKELEAKRRDHAADSAAAPAVAAVSEPKW